VRFADNSVEDQSVAFGSEKSYIYFAFKLSYAPSLLSEVSWRRFILFGSGARARLLA
jgi:hypothetical protein